MATALAVTLLVMIPAYTIGLYVALAVQKRSRPWTELLLWGCILGAATMAMRLSPLPFGLHVPAGTIAMILLVRHLGKGPWAMAVVTVLAIQLAGFVSEGLIAVPVMAALGIPLVEALHSPTYAVLGGLLGNVPLAIAFAVMKLRRI